MKKKLIIGIILLTVCICLTLYYEIKYYNYININNITNNGLKDINVNAYVDVTFVAGTIKSSEENSFYVMFGDGVQYIVYMDNKQANKINNYLLDNPDKSYLIRGITKLIPPELEKNGQKFIKQWLDTSHNHDEENNHNHEISIDDFYQYFGYVYLDNTVSNNVLIKIIIYITGSIGVLLMLDIIIRKYHLL